MENIRRILREEMELNPTERVYDYDPGRDTVPERLPFDIDKLVNSGVVFVTPAINGNPKSKNYKKWMKTPHTHLISLYNVENSSEDGWILKAITKRAPTKGFKGNFVDKIYDGKYNQILWSLEKLGINPMDMLIDMNIQENIRRVLREVNRLKGPREMPNELKRRLQRLDGLIVKVIKDIEVCKYNTPDEFIYVVVDELIWELRDDYHGDLSKLDRFDVTKYVYDFKYPELENYYRENCE